LKILNYIEDEIFFFTQEDGFLANKVDNNEVLRRFSIMEKDPKVGKIDLHHQISYFGTSGVYKDTDLYLADKSREYLMSMHPALWRRSFLLKYLKPNKNIWETELGMSSECKQETYFELLGNSNIIVPMINAVDKRHLDVTLIRQKIEEPEKIIQMSLRKLLPCK
jgi:hypothetical protein